MSPSMASWAERKYETISKQKLWRKFHTSHLINMQTSKGMFEDDWRHLQTLGHNCEPLETLQWDYFSTNSGGFVVLTEIQWRILKLSNPNKNVSSGIIQLVKPWRWAFSRYQSPDLLRRNRLPRNWELTGDFLPRVPHSSFICRTSCHWKSNYS